VRELRISCPDATGLGVDVMRVCLDFGLRITRADISTDGDWCFLVLCVALSSGVPPRWSLLKSRLGEICPSGTDALRQLWRLRLEPKEQRPFLLQVSSYDRQGMLHALTHALWEADVSVFKAHITTTPSGEVLDTFWVLDNREELPEAHRVLEICDRVKAVLGADALCSVAAAPEGADAAGGPGGATSRLPCKDAASRGSLRAIVHRRRASLAAPPEPTPASPGSAAAAADVAVEVDNTTSPAHTLITLRCRDRKGLLYDLFRSLKEVDLRVAYGRVVAHPPPGGCEAELFVQDAEGARVSDPDALRELTDRLREAAALPVRIELRDTLEGAATELTVAAAVEPGGRGRPRVTFDVTQGLSAAGVGIYTADVYVDSDGDSEGGRGGGLGGDDGQPASPAYPGKAREMHRFLVSLPDGTAVSSEHDKRALLEVVRSCLLGTRPVGAPAPLWTRPAAGADGGPPAAARPGARSAGIARAMSARWKGVA
jgi:hypothetical protein